MLVTGCVYLFWLNIKYSLYDIELFCSVTVNGKKSLSIIFEIKNVETQWRILFNEEKISL